MAKVAICDVCKRPTKRLVGKLFLGPRGQKSHADYTHHADIGECCAAKIMEDIRWQPRVKGGNGKRQQHARVA